MAEKLLTDRAVKLAKPDEKIYYKTDGNGLRLQVRPNGAKYWMLRFTLGGLESTLGLGTYPTVTLESARQRANSARSLVAEGIHPSIDRKLKRAQNIARGKATFQAIADEWLARNKPTWSPHHHERNEGLIRRILSPKLGDLPVDSMTEAMLLNVLKTCYDSGTKESARRARGVAQQVFDYAKDTHRASHNPARELARSSVLPKPAVKHFAALKQKDVGALLRELEGETIGQTTRVAILLMLYTGLRDFALRPARWREIHLDEAVWIVPAERMKSGREHRVPLPRQAVRALRALKASRPTPNDFVFAGTSKTGHLAENTIRLALHRLGFEVTAHGLRSLMTDVLNESGFNSDAVERQLDHVTRDKVRAAYLRTDFFDYRKSMMQWFADWTNSEQHRTNAPKMPKNVTFIRAA
jgi:integrase